MRNTVGLFVCMLTAGLCLGLCGCKDPVSYGNIPERSVNFTVRPYDMDNILIAVGGVKLFTYGYNGVCVYDIVYMSVLYGAF